MCLKMPRLAPSLVPWPLPSIDSPFGVLKNGSAAALSGGVPGLDADWAVPCESRHRRRERGGALRALAVMGDEAAVVSHLLAFAGPSSRRRILYTEFLR